jgi:hypothetical protein
MSYSLALVLAALVAVGVAIVRSERPHPRHKFIFQLLVPLDSADEAAGTSADPNLPEAVQHRTASRVR